MSVKQVTFGVPVAEAPLTLHVAYDDGRATSILLLSSNYWQVPLALGLVDESSTVPAERASPTPTEKRLIDEKIRRIQNGKLSICEALLFVTQVGILQARELRCLKPPSAEQVKLAMFRLSFDRTADREMLRLLGGVNLEILETLAKAQLVSSKRFEGNLELADIVGERANELQFAQFYDMGGVGEAVEVKVSEWGEGLDKTRVVEIIFSSGNKHALRLEPENYQRLALYLGFVSHNRRVEEEDGVERKPVNIHLNEMRALPLPLAVLQILATGVEIAQHGGYIPPTNEQFAKRVIALFTFGRREDKALLESLKLSEGSVKPSQSNFGYWVDLFAADVLRGENPPMKSEVFKEKVAEAVAKLRKLAPRPSKKQVQSLDEAGVKTLLTDSYCHLAEHQLVWVPVANFGFLNPEQLGKLTPQQIGSIRDLNLLNSLPKAQIEHVNDEMVGKLSKEKRQLLSSRQMAFLTDVQIRELEHPATDRLLPEQVDRYLTPKKVRQLRNRDLVSKLTKVASVHYTMVFCLLTPEQFQQLTTKEQIAAVPLEKQHLLTSEQRKLLPTKEEGPPPPAPVHPQMTKAPPPVTFWTMQWADWARATVWQKAFFLLVVTPYRFLFG